MTSHSDNIIRLQRAAGGVATNIRQSLRAGRNEIVTNGPSAEFGLVGSDPYNTNAYTGLVVPATPTSQVDGRYLFVLARQSFSTGEQSSSRHGVRLVGIRQYADLVARLPARVAPLASDVGPPTGATVTFRKEIVSPLWHPLDGSISWHVMIINKVQRDTRNPSNTDGFIYQDSLSPSLLYQTSVPYAPPNGGRPWGTPIGASLGNIHDLRYRWRSDYSEYALDIPIPTPCDVVLFASVRQNDPALNPTLASTVDCSAFSALCPEDQFMVAYNEFVQYGSIAGSLVFDQNLGEDVP